MTEKYVPTEEHRRFVSVLAAAGTPQADIANVIINPGTGKPLAVKNLRASFRGELDAGAVQANAAVVAGLYKNAITKGNVAAQIFICKARLGWRQNDPLPTDIPDGPAAADPEDEAELIAAFNKKLDSMAPVFERAAAQAGNIVPIRSGGNGADE